MDQNLETEDIPQVDLGQNEYNPDGPDTEIIENNLSQHVSERGMKA